jgi:hypothetical protein
MTGLNFLYHEAGRSIKSLAGTSNAEKVTAFRNYCEQQPSVRFSDAVGFVFSSLPKEEP